MYCHHGNAVTIFNWRANHEKILYNLIYKICVFKFRFGGGHQFRSPRMGAILTQTQMSSLNKLNRLKTVSFCSVQFSAVQLHIRMQPSQGLNQRANLKQKPF